MPAAQPPSEPSREPSRNPSREHSREPDAFTAHPGSLGPGLQARYIRLQDILRNLGSALVAFSGGVDSTLLLRVAHDVLGERAAGLIALSPSLPARERMEAETLARDMGVRLFATQTHELQKEAYARNQTDRCYHCKHALLETAQKLACSHGFAHVLLGTNADDLGDHRPGHRAAQEHGARHPLLEADLTKEDVRALSHYLGLPTWNKAEMACLASRIPFGMRITAERLSQVERLEEALRGAGFHQVRVRHHGEVARIEVAADRVTDLVEPAVRERVLAAGHAAGFTHIAVDLAGYRRGALHEGMNLPAGAEEAETVPRASPSPARTAAPQHPAEQR